jgi:Tfp pilus assembly protein PilF
VNPEDADACVSCGVVIGRGGSLEGMEGLLEDLLDTTQDRPAAPAAAGDESLDLDAEIVDELLDSLHVEEPAPALEVKVECPLCGTEVSMSATRCDHCGSEFEDVVLDAPAPAAAPAPAPPPTVPTRTEAAPRRKSRAADIPVAAGPTETASRGKLLFTGRLIDLVVGGTAAALVAVFLGFRLYSWSSIGSDPMPLVIFLSIGIGGMGAGFILFRLSTSLIAQGDRLVKEGRYQEAVAYFDRSIRMGHRPSNAWTSRGVAMKRVGRLDEALRSQETAVRIDPENEIAWCNLGDLYFRLEEYPKALESYDKALGIRSRYAIAWNNKGAALARMNRFEEARACHDRAVKLQPRYVAAWLNRGEVLARLGEREEAQKCLERARALGA